MRVKLRRRGTLIKSSKVNMVMKRYVLDAHVHLAHRVVRLCYTCNGSTPNFILLRTLPMQDEFGGVDTMETGEEPETGQEMAVVLHEVSPPTN